MTTPTCSPWRLDYAPSTPSALTLKRSQSTPNPPGVDQSTVKLIKPTPYSASSSSSAVVNPMEDPLAAMGFAPSSLRMKRAWDFAISPAKSLPMQAFMLYMSGSGVQIFSMGTVFMLLSNPIKGVLGIQKAFEPFRLGPNSKEAPASLLPPMLVFILCQCLTLALGLWKCNQMGILPTGSADFLAFETRGPAPETSYFSSVGWNQ
ncbi:putative endoplasmic reticulum protein [Mrakia frigida]|uniref:chaperone EMC4 n=1 Tax=Mrakia frigida TaxID=29902 RepID=UPI003FCBFB61